MDILKDFGVQPTLLFGQIVNFLIILFLLRKFFYGKILKILDDRKKTIEESLKNADLIEQKLKDTEERSAKIIASSQDQAQQIIEDARAKSDEIAKQAVEEAKKTITEALASAQNQIEAQKVKMKEEIAQETLVLVTEVVKKVLGRNLKPQEKQELTKKSIAEITKNI
ncbi:MAG: F0F1 ATP synthase subunit B [Patescibacteria group bacterium]